MSLQMHLSERPLEGLWFPISEDIRKDAQLGLSLYEQFSSRSKMTTGLWRATQLLRWDKLPLQDAKVMYQWFSRHEVDEEALGSKSRGFWGDNNNPSPGWIAFLCWGGYAAREYIYNLAKNDWKPARGTKWEN